MYKISQKTIYCNSQVDGNFFISTLGIGVKEALPTALGIETFLVGIRPSFTFPLVLRSCHPVLTCELLFHFFSLLQNKWSAFLRMELKYATPVKRQK